MACTSAMRPVAVRCSRSRARAVSRPTSCAGTMATRRCSCPAPVCALTRPAARPAQNPARTAQVNDCPHRGCHSAPKPRSTTVVRSDAAVSAQRWGADRRHTPSPCSSTFRSRGAEQARARDDGEVDRVIPRVADQLLPGPRLRPAVDGQRGRTSGGLRRGRTSLLSEVCRTSASVAVRDLPDCHTQALSVVGSRVSVVRKHGRSGWRPGDSAARLVSRCRPIAGAQWSPYTSIGDVTYRGAVSSAAALRGSALALPSRPSRA